MTHHSTPFFEVNLYVKIKNHEPLDFLISSAKLLMQKLKLDLNSLEVSVVGKQSIRKLNYQFRKKDKITDVLSFPMHSPFKIPPYQSLGEIIICYPQAIKQANENKISLKEELLFLMTHALLHLLGYDHEISLKEEIKMKKMEKKLMTYLGYEIHV